MGNSPLSGKPVFVTRRTRLATESLLTLVAFALQGKRVTHLQRQNQLHMAMSTLQEAHTCDHRHQLAKTLIWRVGLTKRNPSQQILPAQSSSSPILLAACRLRIYAAKGS
jgi:hypothetical protein